MKINFYPDYDNPEFEKAAREYAEIWKKEGDKITATIEEISGLKFKEKVINAITQQYVSYSNPLRLQASIPTEHKRADLVHELCHRLTVGNNVEARVDYRHPDYMLEVHKLIDLILYDAFVELYGKKFAEKRINHEVNLWDGDGVSPYKFAWDWATSMTKEERQKEFRKYLLG